MINWTDQSPAIRRMRYRILNTMPWSTSGNFANILRLLLAMTWTTTWGTWRFFLLFSDCWYGEWPTRALWRLAFHWGGPQSPKAMLCDCGWAGPLRWADHSYEDDGMGDVTGVTYCPRCGRDALHPVFWNRKKGGWGS